MSSDAYDPPPSLQQQVAMLKQQLAQAQKLTALGELVSTTTHEFNNVLMTIINYAKMGLRHEDAATREKAFEKILSAGNRAAKITNSIWASPATARPARADRHGRVVEDTLMLLEREMANTASRSTSISSPCRRLWPTATRSSKCCSTC